MKPLIAILLGTLASQAAEPIPNPAIDYHRFTEISQQVAPIREKRRVTEAQFLAMMADPATVVLDARSADRFAQRHVRGALSLPFTEFTDDSLRRAIPRKDTRVLINCNNNFRNDPIAMREKRAPASLNISTYIALTTYGYTNVYELGPLLDVNTTRIPFEGTHIGQK